jgi:hypothetical protein
MYSIQMRQGGIVSPKSCSSCRSVKRIYHATYKVIVLFDSLKSGDPDVDRCVDDPVTTAAVGPLIWSRSSSAACCLSSSSFRQR